MELYQLRSFVCVAREGNLTRASQQLHLTQPAVSTQIKALEDELDEKLFERKPRSLVLTAAGKMLLARAEEVLDLIGHTRDEIEALQGLRRGTVEIGTNDSNCLHVLPDVIASFQNSYPGVAIHLANSHSSEVARWVVASQVELGVVTLPVSGAGLESQKLYDREDVLICRPDHPLAKKEKVAPGDIAGYPLLLLHSGSVSHNRLLRDIGAGGVEPATVMRVGSIEVIKRYTEIGLGVSVIPRLNAVHEIESGRLTERRLPWLPGNEVGVIYRRNAYLSPAARAFLAELRRTVAERFMPPAQ